MERARRVDVPVLTVSPEKAPDKPRYVEIGFTDGAATSIDGKAMKAHEVIGLLNRVAGENGIGRVDIVENRFVGMKSRGVYETPGCTILHTAHRAIETITMDREVMHLRDSLITKVSELIYYGFWYSPEMEAMRAFIDKTQEGVTGTVRLKLYKGNTIVVGRKSEKSLYSQDFRNLRQRLRLQPGGRDGLHQAQCPPAAHKGDAEGRIRQEMARTESRGYDPKAVEEKWQAVWENAGLFHVTEDKDRKKYYLLEMFPYPSGRIHMGHVRNYSIGDVIARYKRMRGLNVLHPMGWDAFGMPAENAAIQHGIHPAVWTKENIAYMKKQLKRLGFGYDWDRELATCDVEYYRWEQWMFLKMYEKGLVYRKSAPVNYCEQCQTVLANEQVEDGRCWRCGAEVVQNELSQWFFAITKYADELYECTFKLPGWPERVLSMQRNWIGKSHGVEVNFPLEAGGALTIFTTRPDTLFGVTFMVLAPEHPSAATLAKGTPREAEVAAFVEKARAQDRSFRGELSLEKRRCFHRSIRNKPPYEAESARIRQ